MVLYCFVLVLLTVLLLHVRVTVYIGCDWQSMCDQFIVRGVRVDEM